MNQEHKETETQMKHTSNESRTTRTTSSNDHNTYQRRRGIAQLFEEELPQKVDLSDPEFYITVNCRTNYKIDY